MVSNEYLTCWCEELAESIQELKTSSMTKEEKLKFISDQYNSLFMLVNVIKGNTLMVGFPHRVIDKRKQQSTSHTGDQQ